MKVNLLNIPSHVLTLADSDHRLNAFKNNIGTKLSVSTFYGERKPTVAEGCYLSSFNLYKTVKPPVLILEDDVLLTEHFTDIIDVPDDADAIYLGTSAWGVKNNESMFKNLNIKKYNDQFYKIEYMTTTHAILFLSEKFFSEILNTLTNNIDQQPIIPIDNHIA